MSVHVSPSVAGRPAFTDPDAVAGAGLLGRERAPLVVQLRRESGVPARAEARPSSDQPEVAADDLVARQLAQALEAARGTAGEGLYADALRLALLARSLVKKVPAPVPAEQPAPPTERARSGLVAWRLKRVLAFIDQNLGGAVTLADMAHAAGLSRMHFAAQFRVATGLRPHEFLLRARIEQAQEMMARTREPLVQIALAVGFQTQAHFTTVFRRFAGTTPHRWRSDRAVG